MSQTYKIQYLLTDWQACDLHVQVYDQHLDGLDSTVSQLESTWQQLHDAGYMSDDDAGKRQVCISALLLSTLPWCLLIKLIWTAAWHDGSQETLSPTLYIWAGAFPDRYVYEERMKSLRSFPFSTLTLLVG